MFTRIAILSALSVLLAACAGTVPGTDSSTNSLIAIQYGRIEQIRQVQMQPSYGKSALLGGGLGALAASHYSAGSQALAAAGGALLGSLVAKERAGTAEQYTVGLVNGNTVAIVSEAHDLAVGDCVSVEQGEQANIRRVDPVMCSSPNAAATHPQIHAEVQQASSDCLAAKQEMLKASTEEQANVAYQKMKALCSS